MQALGRIGVLDAHAVGAADEPAAAGRRLYVADVPKRIGLGRAAHRDVEERMERGEQHPAAVRRDYNVVDAVAMRAQVRESSTGAPLATGTP